MLAPDARHLLLDILRPPDGFVLDAAAGTTYSLDLVSLLTAPVAFAMFDRQAPDGSLVRDPVALLQALRASSDRITLFHGAGQVALPPVDQRLLVYLERAVYAVVPPNPTAIFHPKVWMLRFRDPDSGATRMRFVCMSRNLTPDRSWDTVLSLDGVPGETEQHPELAGFADALVTQAAVVRALPSERAAMVRGLGADLARTTWELPPGFTTIRFWPLGHDGVARWPFRTNIGRMLVISPFLTGGFLARVGGNRTNDVLVSRPEEIDRVGGRAVARFAERLVLVPDAGMPADDGAAADDASADADGAPTDGQVGDAGRLVGLHAKTYVADVGQSLGRIWTGSANATDAAFGGNVEFLVELEGNVRSCGVDAVLATRPGALGLRSIVEPYTAATDDGTEASAEEQARERLDACRRDIGSLPFRVDCVHDADGWRMDVATAATPARLAGVDLAGVTATIWPATLGPGAAVALTPGAGTVATFRVAEAGITPYLGIELAIGTERIRFVVVAALHGAPDGREARVLAGILSDRTSLLRLLLLLLGSTEAGLAAADDPAAPAGGSATTWADAFASGALLEPLLRTFAREPGRLHEIRTLLEEIDRAAPDADLLPPGWARVWEPLAAALGPEGAT